MRKNKRSSLRLCLIISSYEFALAALPLSVFHPLICVCLKSIGFRAERESEIDGIPGRKSKVDLHKWGQDVHYIISSAFPCYLAPP